jgi:hypothetical protein
LSSVLLGAGEDVRQVPTTLTHRERRRPHALGKSDLVDSVAIARIVASGEVLSSAHRVEALTDLRALVDYRDQLVRARTQVAKVLKEAGLVADQAVGTRRVYRINPDGLKGLEEYARSFWSAALTRYGRAARRESEAAAGRTRTGG